MAVSDVAELKKVVKQLQGATENSDIISLLTILKREFHINETVLRESKAGLAVGKLRTHASKGVSELAKEVVRKWKTEVERAKSGGMSNGRLKVDTNVATSPSTSSPVTAKAGMRTCKTDGVIINLTGDKTRDTCIGLMYDSLAIDSTAPSETILLRARAIEEAVLQHNKGANAAYKARLRSLMVNLKDKSNPNLRHSIVSGDTLPESLATMSSEQMASEERKAEDKKIREQNFHDALGASEQQAETDAFQCNRCKQRKCRYRQAQTRSADEPMTTFVTCTNCNHRWKFS
ncbi:transcription elongation factor [Fistulina hepatica ATCC 64428]|uniref:Transcription elongation factor n=1 Tax=Fistulina hepatica ATCC 64428 TaxID=1128425 RepID=A0A0D7A414_9AGAR|nr:transcription elongation factor [Fistulina hepatica ATCC 64428]